MTQIAEKINSQRTPFLKFYTDDWIAGTLELSFEAKGFYLEILLRMWERKGPVPNDEIWLARNLNCNPRTVRKLLAVLLECGKFRIEDGQIINNRMMREISTMLLHWQSKPNSKRIEPEPKESEPPLQPVEPDLMLNSTGRQAKTPTKSKAQKTLPEAIVRIEERKKKEEASQQSVVAVASETCAAVEVLAGDLSDEMISNVSKWAGMPAFNARQWVSQTVSYFGQRVTGDSYRKLIDDLASGVIISRPLSTWSIIANRMRDEAARPADGKRAPWVEEKLKGQRDALKIAAEMGYN